jgi:hypothetical protein
MLEECGGCATIGDASRFVKKTREDSRCFSKVPRHLVAEVAEVARARYPHQTSGATRSTRMMNIILSTSVFLDDKY